MKALGPIAALLLGGCDWVQVAFVNQLPLEGRASGDFYVYLGVDGLSLETVHEAMAMGAFTGGDWKTAKFITMFPGTSDASWTRIMRAPKTESYEFEYYDPSSDSVINSGLTGVARHLMPTVNESLSFEAAYLAAFDYRSNGYTHSLEAYRDPWVSVGDTLDDLFFTMEGRFETDSAFTGYLLESDVLGHIAGPDACRQLLLMIWERINAFRAGHPGRKIHFTLLSDHGMDFTDLPFEHLVDFHDELPKVGVTPVPNLRGRDPHGPPYAVPIVHTRVMYLALHTHPDLIAEVALRSSRLESVDFTAGKLPQAGWYGIWADGRLALRFGYDSGSWVFPDDADFARFGLDLAPGRYTDEALFARIKDSRYPDLFYRLRTSLSDLSVEVPADVLVSFRNRWGSVGFQLPGGLDKFSGGSHGAADSLGTLGVLISDERDLPDAIRADAFLDLFPRAMQHLRDRGMTPLEGDPDAARPHR